LSTPANKEERKCWAVVSKVHTLLKDLMIPDLKDPHGFYSFLCCNKASSDTTVQHKFNSVKHQFHRLAVTNHPDKINASNPMKAKKLEEFAKAKAIYEKQKLAFDII
jgi:hypothetical protein